MAEESKTIIQQLADAQAALADATGKLQALNATHADVLKGAETMKIALAAADEARVKAKGLLKVEQDAHKATQAELATAKQALANPAFADAARKGSAGAGHDGGVAGSEVACPQTKAEAMKQYNALESAAARAQFRKQHAKLLGIDGE